MGLPQQERTSFNALVEDVTAKVLTRQAKSGNAVHNQILQTEKRVLEAALSSTRTEDEAEFRRLWRVIEELEVQLDTVQKNSKVLESKLKEEEEERARLTVQQEKMSQLQAKMKNALQESRETARKRNEEIATLREKDAANKMSLKRLESELRTTKLASETMAAGGRAPSSSATLATVDLNRTLEEWKQQFKVSMEEEVRRAVAEQLQLARQTPGLLGQSPVHGGALSHCPATAEPGTLHDHQHHTHYGPSTAYYEPHGALTTSQMHVAPYAAVRNTNVEESVEDGEISPGNSNKRVKR